MTNTPSKEISLQEIKHAYSIAVLIVKKYRDVYLQQYLNLDKLIKNSLGKLQELRLVWDSSDLENKRRLRMTLFPDGISYNAEKHQYLTTKINEFVSVRAELARVSPENEKENFQHFVENSLSGSGKDTLLESIEDILHDIEKIIR